MNHDKIKLLRESPSDLGRCVAVYFFEGFIK